MTKEGPFLHKPCRLQLRKEPPCHWGRTRGLRGSNSSVTTAEEENKHVLYVHKWLRLPCLWKSPKHAEKCWQTTETRWTSVSRTFAYIALCIYIYTHTRLDFRTSMYQFWWEIIFHQSSLHNFLPYRIDTFIYNLDTHYRYPNTSLQPHRLGNVLCARLVKLRAHLTASAGSPMKTSSKWARNSDSPVTSPKRKMCVGNFGLRNFEPPPSWSSGRIRCPLLEMSWKSRKISGDGSCRHGYNNISCIVWGLRLNASNILYCQHKNASESTYNNVGVFSGLKSSSTQKIIFGAQHKVSCHSAYQASDENPMTWQRHVDCF